MVVLVVDAHRRDRRRAVPARPRSPCREQQSARWLRPCDDTRQRRGPVGVERRGAEQVIVSSYPVDAGERQV